MSLGVVLLKHNTKQLAATGSTHGISWQLDVRSEKQDVLGHIKALGAEPFMPSIARLTTSPPYVVADRESGRGVPSQLPFSM